VPVSHGAQTDLEWFDHGGEETIDPKLVASIGVYAQLKAKGIKEKERKIIFQKRKYQRKD
jgi:hypothetical protein